ncbi:hypothetical protein [Paracoccus kondratievae]|uniref:Uncharacterized protein n=1 Tax=Paracoccus kondratievae TaxID=135740 RepID=A0AAD3RVD7_9RHOB|nr:hypothetical protein [Paracoccus kondratievae]GLK65609.1 hypothetical protein GCM10017635_30860 [Paracoccus kondratievae]
MSDRTEKAEVSVADGSFGDADSLFSGDGQILGAEAGYKKGKLRAEAGAKLGLGVGLGAKVGGGLTGLDKVWARIKGGWNALWGK